MSKLSQLRKYNNRMEEKISIENQKEYNHMILYIRGSKINEYHQEIIRQDMINIILGAQERGEDLAHTFNGDFKNTIDSIIESAPLQDSKERWIYNLSTFFLVTFITLTIHFVFQIVKQLLQGSAVNYVIFLKDAINFLIPAFAALVLVNLMTSSLLFSKRENRTMKFLGAVILFVAVGLFIINRLVTPPILLIATSALKGFMIVALTGVVYLILNLYHSKRYYTDI